MVSERMAGPVVLWDDDGPDGETTRMEIRAGGNGDWYLSIVGETWAGEPLGSDAFRASTSGAKCDLVTSAVVLLAALGHGDREHAMRVARSIITDLERGWSRLPEPDGGDDGE